MGYTPAMTPAPSLPLRPPSTKRRIKCRLERRTNASPHPHAHEAVHLAQCSHPHGRLGCGECGSYAWKRR